MKHVLAVKAVFLFYIKIHKKLKKSFSVLFFIFYTLPRTSNEFYYTGNANQDGKKDVNLLDRFLTIAVTFFLTRFCESTTMKRYTLYSKILPKFYYVSGGHFDCCAILLQSMWVAFHFALKRALNRFKCS